jgi:DNA-binding MurR/RpiR family transcriptional regulator
MKRKEAPSQATTPNLVERIDRLSIKRQEIIRPILEHPSEYVLLSVRAAVRLQTDPATIVRIVRGLGFGSYREFQRHLHELSLVYATSLARPPKFPHAEQFRSQPLLDSAIMFAAI